MAYANQLPMVNLRDTAGGLWNTPDPNRAPSSARPDARFGAQRGEVVGLMLRQSLAPTAVGIGLGLLGAAALSRYLEGLLFGLTPLDASTFAAVAALFVSVAALASFIPARRAAGVDPLIALRCE